MSEIDWHREMLADMHRVNAFRAALAGAVQPGDVVLDIGTGTGLLALFALQCGASKVYAIEQGAIVDVAEEIAARNAVAGQIHFVRGHSSQVELPERVDLVVAELIGSFGLEESIIPVMRDARARFLKPDGRLLPAWLELNVAPTREGGRYWRWQRELRTEHGLDYSPFSELAQHRPLGLRADAEQLLGEGMPVFTCRFDDDVATAVIEGKVDVKLSRSGQLCGWIGWFTAGYDDRPFLSTRPPLSGSSWENVFFPIGDPVAVATDDVAALTLRLDDPFWSWRSQVGEEARVFSELSALPAAQLRPASPTPEHGGR